MASIRLASDLQQDSIVDGPGIRMVLWTQGCLHQCPGCHNPHTHDLNGGKLYDVDTIISEMRESRLQSGLTLSGGEPFLQAEALLPIVKAAKQMHLNIWAYSGFTYEESSEKKAINGTRCFGRWEIYTGSKGSSTCIQR